MSDNDKILKPRDKLTQKMSRDGLIEVNETQQTARRISQRETEEYTPQQAIPPPQSTGAGSGVLEHLEIEHDRSAEKRDAKRLKRETTVKTKASRLQFTEEERNTPELAPHIKKAEKAADRLDAAKAAVPKKKKLVRKRTFDEASGKAKARLHFEEVEKPIGRELPTGALSRPAREAGAYVHRKIHSVEKQNVGVEGAHKTEKAAERFSQVSRRAVKRHARRQKLKPYRAAAKAEKAATKANADFLYQKALHDNPQLASNPISRFWQKQQIKRQYAKAARTGAAGGAKTAAGAIKNSRKAAKKTAEKTKRTLGFAARHPVGVAVTVCVLVFSIVLFTGLSSCSAMFTGGLNTVLASSYTAEDADIRGAEADYTALEADLRRRITKAERDNPGYDEYRINTDEIGHNPWQLAAFLTVLYEDYSRAEVQKTLKELFNLQYGFSTEATRETITETKTVRVGEFLGTVTTSGYCNCPICCGQWSGGPTASGVYPKSSHTLAVDAYNPFVPMGTKVVMNGVEYTVEDTGNFAKYGVQFDVYYDDHQTASNHGHRQWDCYLADSNGSNTVEVTTTETKDILTVTATNRTLSAVIAAWPLTKDQRERYNVLLETKGNRDYLFADDIYANPGEYTKYDIPGEALSDARFANMIREAEKYLGYPYVWGGASPETSFDCSGFVSWVINHCGNGWSYGRLTADGLKGICSIIPKSEAKPGDLIFFQGTYNTSGASHVGIYVGNGMMIHCGSPIQYTSIETSYWQQHFYCFGRLP